MRREKDLKNLLEVTTGNSKHWWSCQKQLFVVWWRWSWDGKNERIAVFLIRLKAPCARFNVTNWEDYSLSLERDIVKKQCNRKKELLPRTLHSIQTSWENSMMCIMNSSIWYIFRMLLSFINFIDSQTPRSEPTFRPCDWYEAQAYTPSSTWQSGSAESSSAIRYNSTLSRSLQF